MQQDMTGSAALVAICCLCSVGPCHASGVMLADGRAEDQCVLFRRLAQIFADSRKNRRRRAPL